MILGAYYLNMPMDEHPQITLHNTDYPKQKEQVKEGKKARQK
jgi:hypothetical protein